MPDPCLDELNANLAIFDLDRVGADYFTCHADDGITGIQVKSPVMERTNDGVHLEGASPQRSAQVGTSVVQSVDFSLRFDQDDLTASHFDYFHAIVWQESLIKNFLERRVWLGGVHENPK